MDNLNKQKFFSISSNKNGLPIAFWMILTTLGLMFFISNQQIIKNLYVIVLALIFCMSLFTNRQYELNQKMRVAYDIIGIACIVGLALSFEGWGLSYIIFFLVMIIIGAFNYYLVEYITVFLIMALSLGVVWFFQDLAIFGNIDVKNIFFIVTINIFFAITVLVRLLAIESLNTKAREKRLLEDQKILEKENRDIKIVFDNMENAIIVFDESNNIKFANDKIIDIFTVFKSKHNKDIKIEKLKLIDSSGRKVSLDEIIDATTDRDYRSDLSVKVDDAIVNINLTVSKYLDDKNTYRGAIVSFHSLTSDEALERTKNEFTSLASHEIRTPLATMDGYIYLILNNNKFEYNDMTKQYLLMLHEATNDLIKLANSILQMSKLDDNSIRVDIESLNMADLIAEVVDSEEKNASAKNIKIECSISKVPLIDTDKVKVLEIITNLVENAIKFTNSGSIGVKLDQIGNEVVVSVEDSGIGIPDMSKAKIFDKFYQVENYDTRKNSGCGFGLYLSKSLAKRIGGDLELESTGNNGSVFSLSLPVDYPFQEDMKALKDKKLKEFIEGF